MISTVPVAVFPTPILVSTVYYQVENGHDRDGLGSEENYFWKTAKERSVDTSIGAGNTATGTVDINIEPELG